MEIKISDELNKIINFARQEAMRTGSYSIAPDHLFLGILRHGSNSACDALINLGINLDELKLFIDSKIFTNEQVPYSEFEHITFSRAAQNVLSITVLEATRMKSEIAGSGHLLLALCRGNSGYGYTYLWENGIEYSRVFSSIESGDIRSGRHESSMDEREDDLEKEEIVEEEIIEKAPSMLEEFGYDLTRAASEGKLDPVVGREDEMERVIRILCRRKKNNAMLVGDPGVGKSAIVEGIAIRIASGDITPVLAGKRVVSLDIGSVVAGTKYRGDFEKRFKAIMKELASDPDIILFMDEFHTLVGAGGASGSLDAANMLKPALARGDIQCIGATTMDEFTKIVEKDGALDRRFQKIVVEPASMQHTVSILKRLKKNYEDYHGVYYTDAAIEACARLSERYITDRCLPDKAIDAMDEAGSMVHLLNTGRKRKETGVSADDIADVISKMTGIPVNKVAESEGERLMKMKERLEGRVIGQEEAVDKVVKAIRRNRAGIKAPNRPVGTFLFFGPTGVGKTHLAKSLAEYLFDSEENMIRLDMSEYMEKFTVSRLIGAPPGYVGFEDGGQLSERVRRKPYCVVLLDEIEKAHPDIFNLLLQVLDEGRLTDSNGRSINFRNTILIMTSNVGSREIEEYGKGVGFNSAGKDVAANRKGILEKAVRKVFPPEFINRIDEQVFFKPLERKDLDKIIDIELRNLRHRVKEAGFRLNVTAAAKRLVADAGYDPGYGARPLKRAIQKYIEDPVSEFIISRSLSGGETQPDTLVPLTVGISSDRENTEVRL